MGIEFYGPSATVILLWFQSYEENNNITSFVCFLCTDTKDYLLFFFNEILQYFLKVQVATGSNMLVYIILNRDVQLGLQRFSIRAVELSRRASNSMGERKKKIKTLRTTIASERQNGHVA